MSDSREQAYNSILMPRVSKIREAIGVRVQSERTSSVANEDDDPTGVLGSRGSAAFQKSLMGVANEDDDPEPSCCYPIICELEGCCTIGILILLF